MVIDGRLWDRTDDDSADARDRYRPPNTSPLSTLTPGVLTCYAALNVVNQRWRRSSSTLP